MQRYDVEIHGVQTTLLLSDADAKARGLTATTKARTPANKGRKPANKAVEFPAGATGGTE
jgi:hypothetical protein